MLKAAESKLQTLARTQYEHQRKVHTIDRVVELPRLATTIIRSMKLQVSSSGENLMRVSYSSKARLFEALSPVLVHLQCLLVARLLHAHRGVEVQQLEVPDAATFKAQWRDAGTEAIGLGSEVSGAQPLALSIS